MNAAKNAAAPARQPRLQTRKHPQASADSRAVPPVVLGYRTPSRLTVLLTYEVHTQTFWYGLELTRSIPSPAAVRRVPRVPAGARIPKISTTNCTSHVHAPGAPLDGDPAVGAVLGVFGYPLVRGGVSFSGHQVRNVHLLLAKSTKQRGG